VLDSETSWRDRVRQTLRHSIVMFNPTGQGEVGPVTTTTKLEAEMSTTDLEFAERSVRYLRRQGLKKIEIRQALESELECPPAIADQLLDRAA